MNKNLTRFIAVLLVVFFVHYAAHTTVYATAPIGTFDNVDTTNWTLNGWAYDPDSPNASIQVRVYIETNGYLLGTFPTNVYRADVNTTKGITGNHGFAISIPEYLQNQYHTFYVYGIDTTGGNGTRLSGSPRTSLTAPNPDLRISGIVDGSTMTISTSKRTAGAIDSLKWNGKEFINAYDHGRELQSASFLFSTPDYTGNHPNPTEAGSGPDSYGLTSTSVLNFASTTPSSLTTIISPAFWQRWGTTSTCLHGTDITNTCFVSNSLIKKNVQIGAFGIDNVIEYDVSFVVPDPYPSATFEIVTGYMMNDFSSYWRYDPVANSLKGIPHDPINQHVGSTGGLPLIFSTPDNKYAMGVYKPLQPNPVFLSWFDFSSNATQGTNKWNCVYSRTNVAAGTYSYTCYVVVGSLATVQTAMQELYTKLISSPISGNLTAVGDTAGDQVNTNDYNILKANLGKTGTNIVGDIDRNGKVDIFDYNALVGNFMN